MIASLLIVHSSSARHPRHSKDTTSATYRISASGAHAAPDPASGLTLRAIASVFAREARRSSSTTDRKFWGDDEGDRLRLRNHHLNGPALGGLVGSARSFSRLLQDQLSAQSALLAPATQRFGDLHTEMRIYPERGIGTVVMVTSTDLESTGFLNRVDQPFLGSSDLPG